MRACLSTANPWGCHRVAWSSIWCCCALQEVRQARKTYDALMAKMAALVDECQVGWSYVISNLPSCSKFALPVRTDGFEAAQPA